MSNRVPVAVALFAAGVLSSSSAPAGLIASTSFENEALSGFYVNTNAGDASAADGEVVDITNDGPGVFGTATVDSTSASQTAGDLGFDAAWVNTRGLSGLSDGDEVGVTDVTDDFAAYPDGQQGYRISDSDGLYRLTFDSVSVAGYSDVVASMEYFLDGTSYEYSGSDRDLLRIVAETDVGDFALIDTTGTDIDDLLIEGSFNRVSAAVPDAATYLRLIAEFDSDRFEERIYFDDVQIVGEFQAPESVPEPGTTLLLLVGGVRRVGDTPQATSRLRPDRSSPLARSRESPPRSRSPPRLT